MAQPLILSLDVQTKSAQQSLDSFRKKMRSSFTSSDTKALEQNIKNTTKEINKLEGQVEKTKQKLIDLGQSDVKPKSVVAMEKELATLEKQLQKADAEFEKLSKEQADLAARQVPGLTLEQSLTPEQYARFQELDNLIIKNGEDTEQLTNRINELKAKLTEVKGNPELTAQGKGYNQELDEATKELNNQRQKLQELQEQQNKNNSSQNIFTKFIKNTTNTANKMSKGVGKLVTKPIESASEAVNKFGKRILGLAKRVFIFTLITKALRGLRDTFGALLKSNSQFTASLAQIKANLWTAFAPIYNAVLPALNTFMSALATATGYVASFVSMLFGKTVKSSQAAAKSLYNIAQAYSDTGSAAKDAAKDAEKYTLSFDTLNQLQSPTSDNGGGGGGGGGIAPDFSTELPDTSMWDDFKRILVEISAIFMSGFWEGFGNADFSRVSEEIINIKENLISIATSPEVTSAASNFASSFIYSIGQVTGATVSIGTTIATNLLEGINQYLTDNAPFIQQSVADIFDAGSYLFEVVGRLWTTFAEIFTVFADENGVGLTANIIQIFSNAFLGITELITKFIGDFLNMFVAPINNNVDLIKQNLDGLLGVFENVTGIVAELVTWLAIQLNEFYDNTIQPLIENITSSVSALVEHISNGINEYIIPVLQRLAERFGEIVENNIKPMFEKIFGFLSRVGELIGWLIESIFKPLLTFLVDVLSPDIGSVIENIGDFFNNLLETVSTVIGGIMDFFNGLIDFFVGIFTGDLDKAFSGIKSAFSGILDAIGGILKGAVNLFINIINGLTSGINLAVGVINKIPGVNIPTIPRIPPLAQGAVLPPNQPFLAMVGDQKHGTNIEAPLSTIEEAVENVLNKRGYTDNQTININFTGNLSQLARVLNPVIEKEKNRGSTKLVKGGAY